MNTLPPPSTATPNGLYSWALVAAAPSPENPGVPVPAIVLINPVPPSTRRTRWLEESAINTLPPPSTATPYGLYSWALVAAGPAPGEPPGAGAGNGADVPGGGESRPPQHHRGHQHENPDQTATPNLQHVVLRDAPRGPLPRGCDESVPRNPRLRWTTEDPDRTTPSGTASAAPQPKVIPTDHAVP